MLECRSFYGLRGDVNCLCAVGLVYDMKALVRQRLLTVLHKFEREDLLWCND